VAVNMVVERIDSMAAVSSAVLPAAIHRRGGCSLTGQNSRGYQSDQPLEQDLVRLHSGGCESKQAGQEFLSVKDSTRRRKVNRTAKLKQCKLDARREQWLSKGSQGVFLHPLCLNHILQFLDVKFLHTKYYLQN
jgi:hypothetical protein